MNHDKVVLDNGRIVLLQGDCLEWLPKVKQSTVDMIFADLPYGTTQNKWDSPIDLDLMWYYLCGKKIESRSHIVGCCKPATPYVMTASQPFTSRLGASNIDELRYAWLWRKTNATGHLNARRMPMKDYEDVLVFYRAPCVYNPQGLKPYNKITKRGHNGSNFGVSGTENMQEFTNYPRMSDLVFPYDTDKQHPTQKPVELLEYLIKTYTNENNIVCDPTMGSGTTGVACAKLNRRFIGIEKDQHYFEIAVRRIQEALHDQAR